MSFKKLMRSLIVAVLALSFFSAHASVVALTTAQSEFQTGSLNQGWWTNNPSYGTGTENDNHFTGAIGAELRSFYTFDLSNVNGTITTATLRVMRGYQGGAVNLDLWDVSTTAAVVNNNLGASNEIFTDLGSGKSYGNYVVTTGNQSDYDNQYDYLDFALNTQALNDLGNGTGFFTIGCSVDAARGQYIFSSTGGDVTSLILEVADLPTPSEIPEPASLAILLAGVGGIAAIRRRK